MTQCFGPTINSEIDQLISAILSMPSEFLAEVVKIVRK